MLHIIAAGLNIVAAFAGLTAAIFWFRASAVIGPSEVAVSTGFGGPGGIDVTPVNNYVRNTGGLNKIAARWSGLAAACASLATIVGWWLP